jgi:hypothetical protein
LDTWWESNETGGAGRDFVIPIAAASLSFTATFAAFFNSIKEQLFDYLFQGGSFPAPTGHKLHLYTTVPDADDNGGVEVSGFGYSAQSISFAADDFFNNGDVVFSFTGSPGAIIGYVVRDGSGNGLARSSITSVSPGSGDTVTFQDDAGVRMRYQ